MNEEMKRLGRTIAELETALNDADQKLIDARECIRPADYVGYAEALIQMRKGLYSNGLRMAGGA